MNDPLRVFNDNFAQIEQMNRLFGCLRDQFHIKLLL